MPTPTKGARLGGGPAHERQMLANLAQSLFEHGRITTTVTKAKRLRPYAERLITFAKRGDLASRRRVLGIISDKGVVHSLFTDIGPGFAERDGGYTRITKVGFRKGDNAPMAVIELVEFGAPPKKAVKNEAEKATKKAAPKAKDSKEEESPMVDSTTDAEPSEPEVKAEETEGEHPQDPAEGADDASAEPADEADDNK